MCHLHRLFVKPPSFEYEVFRNTKIGGDIPVFDELCNGEVLDGSVEAFSCKASGDEKKFAKRLQKQLSNSIVDNGNDEKRSSKEANNSKGNDNEMGKKDFPTRSNQQLCVRGASACAVRYTMSLKELSALAPSRFDHPLTDPSCARDYKSANL